MYFLIMGDVYAGKLKMKVSMYRKMAATIWNTLIVVTQMQGRSFIFFCK
jgi:hypothetical protein